MYLDASRTAGEKRLRMRVRWKSNQVVVDVGHNVDPEKWDRELCRARKNSFHGKARTSAAVLNSAIQRHEDAARFVMDSFQNEPTKDEYRVALRQYLNREDSLVKTKKRGFLDDWDDFVSEQGNECGWSQATYKTMSTMRNHLKTWHDPLVYSLFDEEGMASLTDFFIKQGKKNSTVTRYIKVVRWFLRWAIRKGFCTDSVSTDYKPHLKDIKKRVIFLSWSELMVVYNYTFEKDEARLEMARDKFCFSCFTGLRHSDVVALNKTDVSDSCIYITTQKTHDALRIELNKYSKALVDKYSDLEGSLLFPKISTNKMNDYLKEVGKKCGLDSIISESYYSGGVRYEESHKKWELLTTHCGRRTFICNALMLGIPADVVMKWTGHSDYQAMRPYIDIADETKKAAMALFDEKR